MRQQISFNVSRAISGAEGTLLETDAFLTSRLLVGLNDKQAARDCRMVIWGCE